MSKKYKVEWMKPLVLMEYRGIKRVENPVYIYPLQEKMKEDARFFINGRIAKLNLKEMTFQDIRNLRQEIKNEINRLKKQTIIQEDDRIYYKNNNVDAKDIQEILSWYHKKSGSGSYHLFDDTRQIIHKGQLIVPKKYRTIELEKEVSTDYLLHRSFKRTKKELSCYYSDWEIEEVLWILMVFKEKGIKKLPNWITERYGERADYFRYFMQKDITKLLFLDMM